MTQTELHVCFTYCTSLNSSQTHSLTHFRRVLPIACSPDLWVSRCGVCLRLQGITSALNHVAPCLECAQCNQPAIFLTHKLSEGLTQRLDTHRFYVPIRPSRTNLAEVVRFSFFTGTSCSVFVRRTVNGEKKKLKQHKFMLWMFCLRISCLVVAEEL